MRKDENGSIVVETIGSFMLFLFLMISILVLVNIVTLQARVHNAITQAANTLSIYSYVLEITGAADTIMDRSSSRTRVSFPDINQVISETNSLGETNPGPGGFGDASPGSIVGDIASNNGISETLVIRLVGRYLRNGDMNGDEYLRSVNVVGGLGGLDFGDSVLLDGYGNIKIVVHYAIDYRFGALPLPFPEIRVTQTAMTRAWLGGSGDGYWRR